VKWTSNATGKATYCASHNRIAQNDTSFNRYAATVIAKAMTTIDLQLSPIQLHPLWVSQRYRII